MQLLNLNSIYFYANLMKMKKALYFIAFLLLGISVGGIIVTNLGVCPLDPDVGTSADGKCVHFTLYSVFTFIASMLVFSVQGLIFLIYKK